MLLSIPNASGIYKITCVPTGKFYIGSAVKLNGRRLAHLSLLRRQKHNNRYLQSAWDKYGADVFTFEVIEYVLVPFLLEREQYWLDKLKPYDRKRGFNLSPTSSSILGLKMTPESRARRSVAQTGRKHPPYSAEARQRMSDAHKGKRPSDETRRKLKPP